VSDTQIAGDPVAHLNLASSSEDGAVIIYLEDVRPNGSVVYLSEGVLRLLHRKQSPASASSADPLHSYLKSDEAPMTPGKAEDIELRLSPIATKIRKGERIRIAIAGADAANLERIPASGPETFTLAHGPNVASFVELTVAPSK